MGHVAVALRLVLQGDLVRVDRPHVEVNSAFVIVIFETIISSILQVLSLIEIKYSWTYSWILTDFP